MMTIGSIDLVWYTASDECVLVDFKNIPNAGRNVLDPADKSFLGHYAPQQGVLAGFLDRLGWHAEFNQFLVELVSRKGFTPAPGPKGIGPGKLDTWPPV